jgi:threonine dehydratase
LGLDTKIVGVVAELAPAYQLSFQQRQAVTTNSCATFAEGLAVRIPNQEALTMILNGVERVVAVSDDEIALAMRQIFSATHNVVEGAGASTFAALMREREYLNGQRVGVVFSGANIDQPRYLQVLQGQTPGRTA